MPVKNILFDLGGVILTLDIPKTEAAFAQLVGDRALHQKLYMQLVEEKLFEQFETNVVQETEFLERLQARHPQNPSQQQLYDAWSAMLIEFPKEHIEFLQKLKASGEYQIFLLSNINSIHLREVKKILLRDFALELDELFHKPYYSHLIAERKPNASAFDYVLADAGIEASETLFIDDVPENVNTAQSLGFQTIQHPINANLPSSFFGYIGS